MKDPRDSYRYDLLPNPEIEQEVEKLEKELEMIESYLTKDLRMTKF